jgi:hypothetical protein
MNYDELYPGRFLKAGLIPGGICTYTIKSIYRDDIEQNSKKSVIMTFGEIDYQYVLPKINAATIAHIFGKNTKDWIGKQITLYTTNKIMPFPSRPQEAVIRIYGFPILTAPVKFAWQPSSPAGKPKRREITQTLAPTGALTTAIQEIRSRPPEHFPPLHPWIAQLESDGFITNAEASLLFQLMNSLS